MQERHDWHVWRLHNGGEVRYKQVKEQIISDSRTPRAGTRGYNGLTEGWAGCLVAMVRKQQVTGSNPVVGFLILTDTYTQQKRMRGASSNDLPPTVLLHDLPLTWNTPVGCYSRTPYCSSRTAPDISLRGTRNSQNRDSRIP